MSLQRVPVASVFLAFFRLGLTSFGGPIAHLGYFRDEFVTRRRWMDERTYADLVALCQFLPGPASSQVGIGIGLAKAGLPGSLAAWFAFTLPSAVALIVFGYGVIAFQDAVHHGLLHGLTGGSPGSLGHGTYTVSGCTTCHPRGSCCDWSAGLPGTSCAGWRYRLGWVCGVHFPASGAPYGPGYAGH